MLRRLSALLALVVLAGCGGGDGASGPAGTSLAIVPASDTVRVGGLLRVDIVGGRVTRDSTAATFGGVPVTLARASDSTLVLVAPEVPAGSRVLRVGFGGDTVQASVSVLAAVAIADPVASVTAALEAPLALAPVTAPVGYTQADWDARRAKVDSLVQEAKAQFATLPAADQLVIARMLQSARLPAVMTQAAAIADPAPGDAVRTSIFGDSECAVAKRRLLRSGLGAGITLLTLLAVIAAPPVALPAQIIAIGVTGAAFAGMSLVVLDDYASMKIVCEVQTDVDASETSLTAALRTMALRTPTDAGGTTASQVATTKRFFKNRPVTYYPRGNFRAVSSAEIAKDAVIAEISTALDRLHAKLSGVYDRLPARVRDRLPGLPPRISQTPPGPVHLEPVPASAVRIANVRPSSVQLTKGGAGDAITLTTGATVTEDVPFTYEIVSVYDSTVRKTMSGVARPFMAGAFVDVPANAQGDRSFTTYNNLQYGRLMCRGSGTLRITGGDQGRWETFSWAISGPTSLQGSEPITGRPEIFESGDHQFSAYFYTEFRENDQPVFKPFSVTATVTYTDLVTNTIKSAPLSFNCTL